MALDTTSTGSRRALLLGALGGLGAWAASAIGRASPMRAADGDPLILGSGNASSTETGVTNGDPGAIAFYGHVGGSGIGLLGESSSGPGVKGTSPSGNGVLGESSSGAIGFAGVKGTGSSAGVHGTGFSVGVKGDSGVGHGVSGSTDSGIGVAGSSNSGLGVSGGSGTGVGVRGTSFASNQPAVVGQSHGQSTGLLGYSSTGATPAAPAKTGVYGYAVQDTTSRGVWGRANAGRGVYGQAAGGSGVYGHASSGVGLYGTTTTGYALRTSGRIRADKVSGVATIEAGNVNITVTPGVDVTASSFVLLTPKANLGGRDLWFTTDATSNRFTIRISSARTSSTPVAWLLVG